jgi:23S rRNA (pseudouridine1915-N3)-methyltransferase
VKIRLLAVTHKLPRWLQEGYEDYAKRLPPAYALELVEISAQKRTANADIKRIVTQEGERLLAMIKPDHYVIALDTKGKLWSTVELAQQLASWQQAGHPVNLLVGGPDGLSTSCLHKADHCWSLSPLTFPHTLVRLIVAEQLYRAYTLLQQHPYHR